MVQQEEIRKAKISLLQVGDIIMGIMLAYYWDDIETEYIITDIDKKYIYTKYAKILKSDIKNGNNDILYFIE